jgi:hypothetical protein
MSPSKAGITRELIRRHYQRHPEVYIERVLGVNLTDEQLTICRALIEHGRVIVLASHGVGKSFLMAALINWSFDCFPGSITISTAPTASQVKDVVWKDVRLQRKGRPGLLPKAPRMETTADHFAVGMTAAKGEAFQGRHTPGGVFINFDEAVGINRAFFEAAEGMMIDSSCRWLMICNPTDPGSYVRTLAESGEFKVITISAIEHPNIKAELRGELPPYKGAVTLSYVQKALRAWATKIDPEIKNSLDIEFPPGSGQWYRPGPLFEGKVLGRWPTGTTDNVWSDGHWQAILIEQPIEEDKPLELGVDVARFGDDFTTIIVRRGRTVLYHETFNGNPTTYTVGRIQAIIRQFMNMTESIVGVKIKIDDDGVGGGVSDMLAADGYNVSRVQSGSKAIEDELYPNRRSELWFTTRDLAERFALDISRLSDEAKDLLRSQLLPVKFKYDKHGRKVVESKDDLKSAKRLKRSPDDADALNLAFTPDVSGWTPDIDAW